MLSSTAFNNISKAETYKLHTQLYDKNEEKENLIREKDHIIKAFICKLEQRLNSNPGDDNGTTIHHN